MTLPPLSIQIVYGHLAWAAVLAAVSAVLLSRWRRLRGPELLGLAAVALLLCGPWGAASVSYWLGLVCQWPSALLALAGVLLVYRRGVQHDTAPWMPVPWAVFLAASGTLLYLDSSGWLSMGLYARGFGPLGALAGLVIAAIAVVQLWRAPHDLFAWALLLSLSLFAIARLPTGNVWDALLDPLLWLWAWARLVRAVLPSAPRAPSSSSDSSP